MRFHVHLTDNAKGDIRAILRWLESRSPAGAEAWYRKWLDDLETLRGRADSLGLRSKVTIILRRSDRFVSKQNGADFTEHYLRFENSRSSCCTFAAQDKI